MFVDQASIIVIGGAGGHGCSAMFKAPFTRYPRPSGGNGGDGGDVVLLADPQLTTLLDFQFRHEFRGDRGRHGSGNTKTGRRGADCDVRVPCGTVVLDADTGEFLRDLVTPHQRLVIAAGGRGGMGNGTSAAKRATPGEAGAQRRLRLELKLIADVGLIGFPNAGKSSLLSRLSTARPTIAAYPFTTKTPVLGVVSAGLGKSFVACDIPGLIEGAHEGRGLGIQFLRHIERTRLLVHLIDMAAVDGRDPVEDFRKINEELAAYSHALGRPTALRPSALPRQLGMCRLGRRPQIVVANKMDLPEAQAHLQRFQAAHRETIMPISCATNQGMTQLIQTIWTRLQTLEAPASTGGEP